MWRCFFIPLTLHCSHCLANQVMGVMINQMGRFVKSFACASNWPLSVRGHSLLATRAQRWADVRESLLLIGF